MITFLELGKHGRLGNQLFQYAALKGIALKNGYECKIPDPAECEWHGQKCLLKELNIESEYLTLQDREKIEYMAVEPSPHSFYEQFLAIPDNTNLHGYFQSTYYFKGYEEQIRKELTPKKEYIDFAKEYLEPLKTDGSAIVSVHLRRGDITDGTNASEKYLNFYGKDDIFSKESGYGRYINKALESFKDMKVKYLVFSGGSRTGDDAADIVWAKNNFAKDNFKVSDTNDPMKDLALIMSCDHNIACHMTSFGWWGAYLNFNPDKIVIAPKNYFYDMPSAYVRPGFFPESWSLA
tara:strand:+ start:1700 stop:2578 length:879 start_codon:yes stop_codon:yes gene_type:complete